MPKPTFLCRWREQKNSSWNITIDQSQTSPSGGSDVHAFPTNKELWHGKKWEDPPPARLRENFARLLGFCCPALPLHTGKTRAARSGPVQVKAAGQQSFLHLQPLIIVRGVMQTHAWQVCESRSGLRWVFRRFSPVLQLVWCFSSHVWQKFAPGESGGSSRGESARRPGGHRRAPPVTAA